MKVFATKTGPKGDRVVIIEWTSIGAFERNQSWCDPKFIAVATSADLDFYKYPYEAGTVVYSKERIDSYNLMHEQFNKRGR